MSTEAAHNDEFYLRLYVGHQSRKFGHEFTVRIQESCGGVEKCSVFCVSSRVMTYCVYQQFYNDTLPLVFLFSLTIPRTPLHPFYYVLCTIGI